jgi:hypothetical protein
LWALKPGPDPGRPERQAAGGEGVDVRGVAWVAAGQAVLAVLAAVDARAWAGGLAGVVTWALARM